VKGTEVTHKQWLEHAQNQLVKRGMCTQEAAQAVRFLLMHATGWSWEKVLLKDASFLPPTIEQSLERMLLLMIEQHMPLAYVLGTVPFLDLAILVRPPVLIPRPETEWWCAQLCEHIAKVQGDKPFVLIDMCTGSGCIGLAVAQRFVHATVYGVDISPQACDLARENAKKNGIDNFVVVQSDLFASLELPAHSVDFVVANPPYIPRDMWASLDGEVRCFEDRAALIAGAQGLDCIERIVDQAHTFLVMDSLVGLWLLWIEVDESHVQLVVQHALNLGYAQAEIVHDQYGKNRVVRIR